MTLKSTLMNPKGKKIPKGPPAELDQATAADLLRQVIGGTQVDRKGFHYSAETAIAYTTAHPSEDVEDSSALPASDLPSERTELDIGEAASGSKLISKEAIGKGIKQATQGIEKGIEKATQGIEKVNQALENARDATQDFLKKKIFENEAASGQGQAKVGSSASFDHSNGEDNGPQYKAAGSALSAAEVGAKGTTYSSLYGAGATGNVKAAASGDASVGTALSANDSVGLSVNVKASGAASTGASGEVFVTAGAASASGDVAAKVGGNVGASSAVEAGPAKLSTDVQARAGMQAQAGGGVDINIFGATASGSLKAGGTAAGAGSAAAELGPARIAADVQAQGSMQAQADGEINVGLLGATLQGDAQVNASASGKVSASSELGALKEKLDASGKISATAGAHGEAKVGLTGAKLEGVANAKVGAQADVDARQTLDLGKAVGIASPINLEVGTVQHADAKAAGQASAEAGAKLGLTGAGIKGEAKASVSAEASASAGVTAISVDAKTGVKVNGYAKAEARLNAMLSLEETKFGMGALAQVGASVEASGELKGEDGNSASGTVTLMSPGAAGGVVDFSSKFEDGNLKLKLGFGVGLVKFGVKVGGDVNINLKSQKNAIEAGIKQLQEIKPGDLFSPEKLKNNMSKAVGTAADELIKGGRVQGGIGGNLTALSGHALSAVNSVIDGGLQSAVKDVVHDTAKAAVKEVSNAVNAVKNFFKGW